MAVVLYALVVGLLVEIETARAELRQRFPDTESMWRGLRERNTASMSANAFTAPFGSGPGWG